MSQEHQTHNKYHSNHGEEDVVDEQQHQFFMINDLPSELSSPQNPSFVELEDISHAISHKDDAIAVKSWITQACKD